ncbi:MAG: NAD-dependent epimerase/dehydratase family protein [Proteobacteria bacterium]|nr:NAD-dependent epimerase/dehydratase family protein [Pseudomonadota bacterium]
MTLATCLITGGAGFIGCALSPLLADRFERVVAMDNLHPQIHAARTRPTALDARVELIVADVCAHADWERVLAQVRPDVIVHLAAETGTAQSLTESARHAQVNVTGMARMLDALVRHAALPERIVLASSRAVYGEGAWRRMTDGASVDPGQRGRGMLEAAQWDFPGLQPLPHDATTTPAHPTSVYGATKLAQEHVLSAWAQAVGVRASVLRLQNVYGPGQSLGNPYTGIVPLFCQIARAGNSIPVYEDGAIVRDFVAIDDVARAIFAASCGEIGESAPVDIGSGRPTTILELAQKIAHRYGAPAPTITGQYRHGDVRQACARIDAAWTHLGWHPCVRLDAGLERLCAWIDAHPDTTRGSLAG